MDNPLSPELFFFTSDNKPSDNYYFHLAFRECLTDSPREGTQALLKLINRDFAFNLQSFYFCITGVKKSLYHSVYHLTAPQYMRIFFSANAEIKEAFAKHAWTGDIFLVWKEDEKQIAVLMSPLPHARFTAEEMACEIDRLVQGIYEKELFKSDKRYRNATSLCGPFSDYEGIRAGYKKARKLNDLSFLHMDGTIFTPAFVASTIKSSDYSTVLDKCMALRVYVDEGNVEQSQLHLRELFLHTLRSSYNLDLLDHVLSFLRNALEIRCTVYNLPLPSDTLCQRASYHRIEECVDALSSVIHDLCRSIAQHGSYTKPVLSAMYYIHRHATEYFTLEDVARHVGISPCYLTNRFSTETGMSMRNYITRLRMEEAQKLLLLQEMTVAQIAVAVGYDDVRYFSRLFKQHTGITPTEYRMSQIERT